MQKFIITILTFLIFLANAHSSPLNEEKTASRGRRQTAPFDDLIHSALQLVRPIFGSAKSIAKGVASQQQESPMLGKKNQEQPRLTSARLRELDILGIGHNEPMLNEGGGMEMLPPICQGNSQICKFIACTAHNFKNNQNFANLQLVTQLLSDRKLRRTVGANAGSIAEVCREQGMSGTQCAIFSRTFQLIDRFMTNIEEQKEQEIVQGKEDESIVREEEENEESPEQKRRRFEAVSRNFPPNRTGIVTVKKLAQSTTTTMASAPAVQLSTDKVAQQQTTMDDEPVSQRRHSSSRNAGSRTWSIHKRQNPPAQAAPPLSSALDESHSHFSSSRIPLPPNSPPRAYDFAKVNEPESQRRLTSYSSVPMQMLASAPAQMPFNDPPIARRHSGEYQNGRPPMASAAPLDRPKQFLSATTTPKPLLSISAGGLQQIALQQRPIAYVPQPLQQPQQIFNFNGIPSFTVTQLIPSTMTTPLNNNNNMPTLMFPPTARRRSATTASSTIPEAEEFAEEDGDEFAESQLEMLNNELTNWITGLRRDEPAADYYDDLVTHEEEQLQKKQRAKSSGSGQQRRNNGPRNGGGQLQLSLGNGTKGDGTAEEDNDYSVTLDDDEEASDGERVAAERPANGNRQQQKNLMDNCLQYLG